MLMATDMIETAARKSRLIEPTRPEADWFFVRIIRGTDQQAIDAFAHRGLTTYYPRIVELKRVPMRRLSAAQRASGVSIQKPVPSPLFPRYLLLQADLAEFDWQEIFKQTGAAGFACEGNQPVRIRPNDLAKIKARENSGLIDGRTSVRVVFGVGEQITITSGPFASYPGTVERGLDVPIGDLDPSARIKVAVSIFGRATPAELEVWQVAKHQ